MPENIYLASSAYILYMKVIVTVVASVLSAIIVCLAVFLPEIDYENKTPTGLKVVSVWHVDMFEGGRGSRASYLRSICAPFENENECLINVVNETADDVIYKISNGVLPDIISFSAGLDGITAFSKRLEGEGDAGGAVGGKVYAKAWAFGGYVLIKRKGRETTSVVLSKGRFNCPEVACFLNDIDIGKAEKLSPQRAYERFLSDGGCMLVGTQRDIYRLKKNIDDYEVTPLSGFTDLVQYVAVLSEDKDKAELSEKFVAYLLSEGQKNINTLGLMSVDKSHNIGDNGLIDRLFDTEYDLTISVFTPEKVIGELSEKLSDESLSSEVKAEFLKKSLKSLK